MTTTTAMTIKDLRNRVNGHDGEDRISTLPDELIHHIFSFLDVDVTVKTCVLSKRWVNLWTTLPFLNFRHNKSKGLLMSPQGFHDYNNNKDRWSKFDSQFLVKRNPNSDTSTVLIDYTVTELMARQIIEYASSHHVKHLCVNHFGYCYWNFSFPVLETLYINSIQPLNYWSMPSLTVLHCRGTIANNYCDRAFTFEGFHHLRELTLEGCRDFIHKDVFMIKFPNLVCLTISPGERYENHRCCEFVILAPKLSSFKFHGKFVPVMTTEGGFPCLKEVNFDLYDCQENIDKELMKKLNSLFSEFRGIEFLTLSWVLEIY